MSFSEEFQRVLKLVDEGMSIRAAAAEVGMPVTRAYKLMHAAGRPIRSKTKITDDHRAAVVADFTGSRNVSSAARAAGISHAAARRILVTEGLLGARLARPGKAEARVRYLELIEQGWSNHAASREVGVNPRTGRDWRQGIRRSGPTRVHPDGTVVDYRTGARYLPDMTTTPTVVIPTISERYLSLDDRRAIADGLINNQSLRRIASGIGKNVSTVSREVRAHSIEGLYLPHGAHRDAARARARVTSPLNPEATGASSLAPATDVDDRIIERDEATKGTFTLEEIGNIPLILAARLEIDVPVLLVNGTLDGIFCRQSSLDLGTDCSSDERVVAQELPCLPDAPSSARSSCLAWDIT